MAKLQDFGAKIGGARKDLWKTRGLISEDISEMTDLEKQTYVKRDNIWPKPNVEKLVAEGQSRFILFWKNEMRKTVYPKTDMMQRLSASHPEKVQNVFTDYVNGVQTVMALVDEVNTETDIRKFYNKALSGSLLVQVGSHTYDYFGAMRGVLNAKILLKDNSPYGLARMKTKMEKSGFGLTDEEIVRGKHRIIKIDGVHLFWKANCGSEKMECLIWSPNKSSKHYYYISKSMVTKKDGFALLSDDKHEVVLISSEEECRDKLEEIVVDSLKVSNEKVVKQAKKKWVPAHLEHLQRTGPVHMHGEELSGDLLLSSFGLRGGEFGNYVRDKERQLNLEYCFDAFWDLSDALGIDPKSVGLPGISLGSLAIAFGARGRGNAVAHYEPLREVINITKIRGAGSLAHEWGHALDHFIGQTHGAPGLATECIYGCRDTSVIDAIKNVKNAIYYTPSGEHTDYYNYSIAFDKLYTKQSHGYWSSACELFARAFSVYVLTKLDGMGRRNDYLCGHSESFITFDYNGNIIKAYPVGQERVRINEAFDKLFFVMKKEKLLCGNSTI